MYANQINLGQRGSHAINGFGEAAQTFFGKNLGHLDLAECALLAGTIQSPTRLNPYRPFRARDGAPQSWSPTPWSKLALSLPVKPHAPRPNLSASRLPTSTPVKRHTSLTSSTISSFSVSAIRTSRTRASTSTPSLDLDFQQAFAEAVEIGMKNVDEIVRRQHKTPKGQQPGPITYPQVALVAINPHTGQVLALVGGRNYGVSQLNHAVSQRPTGSIFKPFVYAAAYNSSLNGLSLGDGGVFTALTQLNDEETTFTYDNGRQTYTPKNLISGYKGDVIAAYALAHSLNAATVQLAQMVGFDNVAALARASGIINARGTPSVAIRHLQCHPHRHGWRLHCLRQYPGVHLTALMLASVRNTNGDIVSDFSPEAKQVMDPRAAFLTQSLLEGVMNYGTAAAVRGHGFTAPAAGKTGTSHDAWFAGYTSNLLCIVWVGNDDYTSIEIEGAHAAAPIWTEFMKRAIQLPQYSDVKPFTAPEGVTIAHIDKTSDLLVDSTCPSNSFYVAFLDGTAPVNTCSQMGENPQNFIQKIFGIGGNKPATPDATHPATTQPPATSAPIVRQPPNTPPDGNAPDTTQQPPPAKKKNFLQKLFGGGKDKQQQPQPQSPPPQ